PALELAGNAAGVVSGAFAQHMPQNQIVAQEVNLGLIREIVPPEGHIGLSTIAPWLSVESDDVVFDYVKGSGSGLAPARAEDAESELWTDDEFYSGRGSASVIDWALKNHYTASDVSRYREMLNVISQTEGQGGSFPLTVNSITEGFQAKVARDTRKRKNRLDNRIEWLIMEGISKGAIEYNDGKIRFKVDYGRPTDQHDQAPKSGSYATNEHDPLNDILDVQEKMYDKYGVTLKRAICSRKFLNTLYRSKKWGLLSGLGPNSGVDGDDMNYLLPGWGPQAAVDRIAQETGLVFTVSDNVMRTRSVGSTSFTNTRYFPQDQVIFLPDEAEISAYDDTEIGFAKTLTSPHPMADWQTGFYSWERETTDPWGHDIGTGVKAFPVFAHMDLSYTMKVELS
ncbi:MAG: major capsid protein, partial [Nocardioidaceae bacterium]|nr:major capsid protein [Nocardioidaceae bacterium]